MKDCKYFINGKLVGNEAELDSFIRNNYNLKDVGDFRFSKDPIQDNINKIIDINKKNHEALEKHKAKEKEGGNPDGYEEFDDSYSDDYISALTFNKDTIEEGSKTAFNLKGWISNKRKELESQYSSEYTNKEERDAKIQETLNSIQDNWEGLRKVGKGLHLMAEKIFMTSSDGVFNTRVNSSFIKRFKEDVMNKNSKNISVEQIADDESLLNIAKYMVYVRNTLAKDRKVRKVFVEPILDYTDDSFKIRGKADVIIVYEDGGIDIIDFKFSSKGYNTWDRDKKETAWNQLELYKIMLNSQGVSTDNLTSKIVPVQLNYTKDGKFTFKAPSGKPEIYTTEGTISYRTKVFNILNIRPEIKPITSEIGKGTINAMTQFFGYDPYLYGLKDKNLEYAFNNWVTYRNGQYEFKDIINRNMIRSSTKEGIMIHLSNYMNLLNEKKANDCSNVVKTFNSAEKKFNHLTFPGLPNDVNDWVNRHLIRYRINEGWRAAENPDLDQLGVIMFINDITKEIELISITYSDILNPISFSKGSTLLGNFVSDREMKTNPNMLLATEGNMEMMKLLYLANQLSGDYTVGKLNVLSIKQDRMTNYNDDSIRNALIYNYNSLSYRSNIQPSRVKYSSLFKRACDTVFSLSDLNSEKNNGYRLEGAVFRAVEALNKFADRRNEIREANSKVQQLTLLKDLRDSLNELYFKDKGDALISINFDNALVYLYYEISRTIGELEGITIDSRNRAPLSSNLVGGNIKSAIANESLFNSTQLNTLDTNATIQPIYKKLFQANQQLRTRYYAYKTKDREWVDKFKDSRSSALSGVTNRYEIIYKNLFDTSENGQKYFLFKDYRTDSSLNNEERTFLKRWLEEVNKIRFPEESLDDLEARGERDRWFAVPILRAEMASQIINNKKNIKEAAKENYWDPDIDPQAALGSVVTETDFGKNNMIFDKMYNIFSATEDWNTRAEIIQSQGIPTFETNMERIKDMYVWSNIRSEIYTPILKTISAALTAYAINSKLANTYDTNKATIDFIIEYINSSVLDKTLIGPEHRDSLKVIMGLRNFTSKLLLGCNILSMAKEGIVGYTTLLNNALANKFSGYKDGFSPTDAAKAYTAIWVDSIHQMHTITMGEHFNFLYGIANYSPQEMVERANYYQGHVGRFNERLFWTSRAPDFLHRMTIFYAYMNKYDCLKAHHLKDGHIFYNWKEDGRFKTYAKYKDNEASVPPSLMKEFQDQRALYEAMKARMLEVGTIMIDRETGEARNMNEDDDIPMAFTDLEASKIIQEANTLFGYMDNDNKSLIFRKGIGIILGQFQTYISAKKNQYFLKPDVYNQGRWVYKKNAKGEQLYKAYDDAGNPIEITENNGHPIKVWEGSIMKGIFWSMRSLAWNNFLTEDGRAKFKQEWSDPINRKNLYLFFGDMFGALFWILICKALYGGLTKSEMSYFDRNMEKVFNSASGELYILAVFTGQLQFKFTAMETLMRLVESTTNVVFGDTNAATALASNVGALRPFKDLIYDSVSEE